MYSGRMAEWGAYRSIELGTLAAAGRAGLMAHPSPLTGHPLVPENAKPRGREGWASGRGWSHNWGAEGQLMPLPQPPLPRSCFPERRAL